MTLAKLRASWNVPGNGSAADADDAFFGDHAEAVRALPGIERYSRLKYLPVSGNNSAWWRGEDIFFTSREALREATTGEEWDACWRNLKPLITAPRFTAFSVTEEFDLPASEESTGEGPAVALSGIWQVPARQTPEEVDPIYLKVHVPNVRRLRRLRRHSVLESFDWPEGQHSRAWRSAEIRFDTEDDFDSVFDTTDYEVVRKDGFNASVAGPDVDIYSIEEWCTG